jgi:hypothetical protein
LGALDIYQNGKFKNTSSFGLILSNSLVICRVDATFDVSKYVHQNIKKANEVLNQNSKEEIWGDNMRVIYV